LAFLRLGQGIDTTKSDEAQPSPAQRSAAPVPAPAPAPAPAQPQLSPVEWKWNWSGYLNANYLGDRIMRVNGLQVSRNSTSSTRFYAKLVGNELEGQILLEISAVKEPARFSATDSLRQLFNIMDIDGSGRVTLKELRELTRSLNVDPKKDAVQLVPELMSLFKDYDANRDGEIDFDEFTDIFNDHLGDVSFLAKPLTDQSELERELRLVPNSADNLLLRHLLPYSIVNLTNFEIRCIYLYPRIFSG
jgi:Ca2+-binding EF-hand superfamily protein